MTRLSISLMIGAAAMMVASVGAAQDDDGGGLGQRLLDALQESAAAPRVAIITSTLRADNGEAVGEATNVRSRIINSYGPKAFARDQGAWRVTLYCIRLCGQQDAGQQSPAAARAVRRTPGAEPIASYRIVNPLHDIEREAQIGETFLFEQVRWNGPYEWELIVPLYDGGRRYVADWVVVTDIEAERIVLRAQIAGDAPAAREPVQ